MTYRNRERKLKWHINSCFQNYQNNFKLLVLYFWHLKKESYGAFKSFFRYYANFVFKKLYGIDLSIKITKFYKGFADKILLSDMKA